MITTFQFCVIAGFIVFGLAFLLIVVAVIGKGDPKAPSPFIKDDAEAIASDWQAVGDDLRRAMGKQPPINLADVKDDCRKRIERKLRLENTQL